MRPIWTLLASFCVFLPATAQVRVCMGGNLDTLGATERRSCEDQVSRVREAAAHANAPANWHFVVVCGEDGWKDYMAFSAAGEAALQNAAADVDLVNRTTFLRGSRMMTVDASDKVIAAAFQTSSSTIQIAQK